MTEPNVKQLQWSTLQEGLAYLSNAKFEYERGNLEAGEMWIEDLRRSLGVLALTLAEGPDVEGYARLFGSILTPPTSQRGVSRD